MLFIDFENFKKSGAAYAVNLKRTEWIYLERYSKEPELWFMLSGKDLISKISSKSKQSVNDAFKLLTSGKWVYSSTGADAKDALKFMESGRNEDYRNKIESLMKKFYSESKTKKSIKSSDTKKVSAKRPTTTKPTETNKKKEPAARKTIKGKEGYSLVERKKKGTASQKRNKPIGRDSE